MKLFQKGAFLLTMFFSTANGITQNYQQIPEFTFSKPKLIYGQPNQDGAVYRFSNIAPGYDATITIIGRSSGEVILDTIDIPGSMGYDKSLQPQCGYSGIVPAHSKWWMKFKLNFYQAGTTKAANIDKFNVTALDIDGDGTSISEDVTMFKSTSVKFNPSTLLNLLQAPPVACPSDGKISLSKNCSWCNGSGYSINNKGKQTKCNTCNGTGFLFSACGHAWTGADYTVRGPLANSPDIDTSATKFMADFAYNNVTSFTFQFGGSSGSTKSNAGVRFNSIWFKAFRLVEASPIILPVKLISFTTVYDTKNVMLKWNTSSEVNFSHFIIQKSIDGKTFSDAALVFSNGTENGNAGYIYKDPNVISGSGVLYYRLEMIDKNQQVSYSQISIIRIEKENEMFSLITYPNPVTDQIRITLPANWQGKNVNIEIYSSNGTRVQSQINLNASQTEIVRLNNLTSGIYFVKALCDNKMAVQKVIKI